MVRPRDVRTRELFTLNSGVSLNVTMTKQRGKRDENTLSPRIHSLTTEFLTSVGRQQFTHVVWLWLEARHRLSAQDRAELHTGSFIVLDCYHV